MPLTAFQLSTTRPAPRTRVAGISALEVIVAMTLLTTALSVGTQVVVRARRVMDDHRDYRLALDEVSNVLDGLTVLPSEELEEQLDALSVGSHITTHLDNPSLTGETEENDVGTRITLQLTWGPNHQAPKKVTLSGWQIAGAQASPSDATAEGDE
jgi:hypothetical protein